MIIDMISWWYSQGIVRQFDRMGAQLRSVAETFSITILLETLFAPFRQIDAGLVQGPINIQFRAWIDRSLSRFFGFFIRLFTIITGLVGMLGVVLVGLVWFVIWIAMPILPVVGFIVMLVGGSV